MGKSTKTELTNDPRFAASSYDDIGTPCAYLSCYRSDPATNYAGRSNVDYCFPLLVSSVNSRAQLSTTTSFVE
jgi:hypothetical protein